MVSDEQTALQRLEVYLTYKKIAPAKLEKMAGLANGYIRKNKGSLSSVKLGDILSVLPDLNGDWLLTGRGNMLIDDTDTSVASQQPAISTQGGSYFEQGRGAQHIGQLTGTGDNVGEKLEVSMDHDHIDIIEENMDLSSLRKTLFRCKNRIKELEHEVSILAADKIALDNEVKDALRTVHELTKENRELRKKR